MTIDEYLDWRGMTAKQLALVADIDEATISRLRRGMMPGVTAATIEKLRAATKGRVTFADVAGGGNQCNGSGSR